MARLVLCVKSSVCCHTLSKNSKSFDSFKCKIIDNSDVKYCFFFIYSILFSSKLFSSDKQLFYLCDNFSLRSMRDGTEKFRNKICLAFVTKAF